MKESLRRTLNPALRAFLRDHSEWEDEIGECVIGGRREATMTMNCTMAFAAWCKDRGVGDREKVGRFLREFEDGFDQWAKGAMP